MSREIKIDNQLDNNLRQLKIGETSTPIELATDKIRINSSLELDQDLKINGDLTIGGSTSEINMSDGVQIETTTTAGSVGLKATGLSVYSLLYDGDGSGADNNSTINLLPSNNYDAQLKFYNGAAVQWSIGNDGDDSDKLKFDVADNVGGATKMTLDDSGNLTLVGDLAVNGDDITTDGAMNLDSGGAITLDAADGRFVTKNNGTEFSVANSAYAGMILGYRMIGEDTSHDSYTLTTSYAVPNSDMTVRFVAPPSGCVEVMVQIYANASTSNRFLYFGLSDNATYNSIGVGYEQIHRMPDETDDSTVQHYWTITGLTGGTTYNYWLGAKTNLTNSYLNWGGTATGRYCDFIMKVTALPADTSDFAEYN